MKKYKLYIDRDKCISCGTCVSLMPEVFEIDDADGLIRVENSKPQKGYFILEIDESQLESFQQVVDSCPSQVFRIQK
ncbi:ferredoxin [bacterium]|jgi:ferredoxin|nr:ferredoxin [Candidatus Komeilibacteria bacterium]MBT7552985.1 ferredoxin [bacterium]